jgi:hypothetical protein
MASASASALTTSTTSAGFGVGCFPADPADRVPPANRIDVATLRAELTGALQYLPTDAEGAFEAAALNVNKAENDVVLGDFPHGEYGAEVFLLVNVGSTTTQIYDYHSGLFVGAIDGGSKTWDGAVAVQLMGLIASRSQPLHGTPNVSTPWKGNWRPTSIAVVGAAGYSVPEGTTKWHAPATVPTPITGWLAELPQEFAVAVLNRTKAAKIRQPNCDWGSAVASQTEVQTRDVWPEAPSGVGAGIIFDIGGGYSRCYNSAGRKITVWDQYRPAEKANDYLFPDGVYSSERREALVADIEARATRMLRDYPENATGQVTPITLIATGDAREHYFSKRVEAEVMVGALL